MTRNPQDTTLRNTRAANKRLDKLEQRVKDLEDMLKVLLLVEDAQNAKSKKSKTV